MKFEGKFEGRELKPRPTRIDTSFDVLVRSGSGEYPATIINMSGSGFRLSVVAGLEAGAPVSLEIPLMPPVKGLIRWVTGGEAGGVFLDAVAL
jgi:hypothetical protein